MSAVMHPVPALLLTVALLAAAPASAQTVTDGSEAAIGAQTAEAVFALVGKGMRDPSAALYSRLRTGRAGAVCGEVDATNRMGNHTGRRPLVADPAAGVAQYRAMQRTLDLHRANCAAE